MALRKAQTIFEGVLTATGTTAAVRSRARHEGALLSLNVTDIEGTTPAITVGVQTSLDGVIWSTLDAFAATSGSSDQQQVLRQSLWDQPDAFMWLRLSVSVSGTDDPSFNVLVRLWGQG